MSAAGVLDFDGKGTPPRPKLEQGADFEEVIEWEDATGNPQNLTGWTAGAQVRKHYDDADPPLLTFTCAISGTEITLTASAAATAALNPKGNCVYDVLLTSPTGEKIRLLQGKVVVGKDVTR